MRKILDWNPGCMWRKWNGYLNKGENLFLEHVNLRNGKMCAKKGF